ncbi:MAG: hypothetical protein PHP02_01390 [Eubacteriales bacterium]|nr:hypothetical protein [Eubacteriales bacterium]
MAKKKKGRRGLRALLFALLGLALAVFINFIPTFRLKTPSMRELPGKHAVVHYEREEDAARDVFALAEAQGGDLKEQLGIEGDKAVNIYLYDRQSTLQTKKYGFAAALLGLDWYIGDNVGDNALLVSPGGEYAVHGYEDVRQAALHEMVHAYNYHINPRMPYWIDNGVAGWLSGQTPNMYWERMRLPSLKDTRVFGLLSPVRFARFDGYAFSYMYIKYLADTYGWDAVRTLLHTGDYPAAFGVGEEAIYENWANYMAQSYGVTGN